MDIAKFLTLLDLIHQVLFISECVGKTLIAFDFDEKLKQGDAQVTMWYHVSKDFLPLHFAVGQVLSISGYNLENGTRQ